MWMGGGCSRGEENNHAESVQRIRNERQRAGSGRGLYHRCSLRENRHVAGSGYYHAADRPHRRQGGFFRFIPEPFRKVVRDAGGSESRRRTHAQLRAFSEQRGGLPDCGLRGFPDRENGEHLEQTRAGSCRHHEGMPVLRIVHSAEGDALPELHVRTARVSACKIDRGIRLWLRESAESERGSRGTQLPGNFLGASADSSRRSRISCRCWRSRSSTASVSPCAISRSTSPSAK